MSTRFEKARFHIEYGPASLFKRVRFKLSAVTSLRLDGIHFNSRRKERNIPADVLQRIDKFDINQWKLLTCEIRTDKGKFVNSTWETIYANRRYWITVGFNNLVQTVIQKESSGLDDIVKSGDLYDYVDQINTALMVEAGDSNV